MARRPDGVQRELLVRHGQRGPLEEGDGVLELALRVDDKVNPLLKPVEVDPTFCPTSKSALW